MGRRRRRNCRGDWPALMAAAFGLGLFLSLFCSPRFVLIIAAAALVYLGVTFRC